MRFLTIYLSKQINKIIEYQRFEAHLSRATRTSETYILKSVLMKNVFKTNLEMSDLNQTLHASNYDINHYF